MFNSQVFFLTVLKSTPRKKKYDHDHYLGGTRKFANLFYLSVFHSVGASIIQKPSLVIVEEGHKVSLVCQATGQPTPTVT